MNQNTAAAHGPFFRTSSRQAGDCLKRSGRAATHLNDKRHETAPPRLPHRGTRLISQMLPGWDYFATDCCVDFHEVREFAHD